MLYDVGSTITLEAWDPVFKPILDWNHAWGVAPASIIPRRLMGVRPLAPGYALMVVQPHAGALRYAQLELPTIRGPVFTRFDNAPERVELEVRLPASTSARACPRPAARPARDGDDGRPARARPEGAFAAGDSVGAGRRVFEFR